MRNIEREKKRLETEEKKMKAEIKKMATNNQHVIIITNFKYEKIPKIFQTLKNLFSQII